MAMSLRPRGGATRRTRPGNRPVYEDFKPTTESKHEEGADIVLYHLPGFSKEQIRIIAESKGVLRVQGERLVTSNRWSRFQEKVVVPEDCNLNEVRAKFESGILRIIMPKKPVTIIDRRHPIIEEQVPKPTPAVHEPPPRPSPTTPADMLQQPQPLPQHEPSKEDLPSKPALPPIRVPPYVGTSTRPPQQPYITEPTTPRAPVKPSFDFKPPHHNHGYGNNDVEQRIPDYLKGKGAEDNRVHEESANIVDSKRGDQSKGSEQKHKNKYVDAVGDPRKEGDNGGNIINRFDNQMNVVIGRLSKKLDEDGYLLVNMGAAMLVILALGTYITYSFGSRN